MTPKHGSCMWRVRNRRIRAMRRKSGAGKRWPGISASILAAQPLHPEKIKYYLERRNPDFEAKMRKVLIVYQDVGLQNAKRAAGEAASGIITVSVDEKPGVQAIANNAPDLPPVPGKHPKIG